MIAAKSANARIAQKIAENITLPKAMRRAAAWASCGLS